MTKTEMRKAKAELKRLNALIAKAEGPKDQITVYRNVKNSEAFGTEYSYVKIPKDATELRAQLKALRWGDQKRGKARWDRNEVAWSVLASALKGTVFAK